MIINVLIFQKNIVLNDYVPITLVLILLIDKISTALVITASPQLQFYYRLLPLAQNVINKYKGLEITEFILFYKAH